MRPLAPLPDRSLPADFLVARLHGRLPALAVDWTEWDLAASTVPWQLRGPAAALAAQAGAAGVGRFCRQEALWVYRRASLGLRRCLAPVFLWLALPELAATFRLRLAGLAPATGSRLLDPDLTGLLAQPGEPAAMLARLDRYLAGLAPGLGGLAAAFGREGGRGAERRLADLWWQLMASRAGQPLVASWLDRLAGVLVHTRQRADPADGGVAEAAGLAAITVWLRRQRSEGSGVGFLLHYLWTLFRYRHNLGLILAAAAVAPERVGALLLR
ncbi:MAG: hypothetical protein AB1634_04165 [Thermodesulfobacteriota bacterium]